MATKMTVHNFKFDLEKVHIPLFLGKGGKNFFTKVVLGSIKAFKELEDETHQETIDMVKNGELVIKNLRIDIKRQEDVQEPFTYASWSDVKVLGKANVLLIEIIQKKIVECAEGVRKFLENKNKKSENDEKPQKKFRRNFNYRVNVDEDVEIGRFIGRGGETVKKFNKKIAETLGVEKVYVNIEEFDCDDLCMYRCIGDIIDSTEDLMFKVSFLGGEREDILKVEKMIVDFISENCGDDSDNDSDNDSVQSDNDDDGNDSD